MRKEKRPKQWNHKGMFAGYILYNILSVWCFLYYGFYSCENNIVIGLVTFSVVASPLGTKVLLMDWIPEHIKFRWIFGCHTHDAQKSMQSASVHIFYIRTPALGNVVRPLCTVSADFHTESAHFSLLWHFTGLTTRPQRVFLAEMSLCVKRKSIDRMSEAIYIVFLKFKNPTLALGKQTHHPPHYHHVTQTHTTILMFFFFFPLLQGLPFCARKGLGIQEVHSTRLFAGRSERSTARGQTDDILRGQRGGRQCQHIRPK